MAGPLLAGISELLDLLGRQINAQGPLYRLCLVNRVFNSAFTPHLYKYLRWDKCNTGFLVHKEKQQLLLDSGNLVHTRAFVILTTAISCCLKGWESDHPQQQQDWNDWHYLGQDTVYTELCGAVTRLLPHLKQLQGFTSQNLAISSGCMMALAKIKSICVLSIEFPIDNDGFVGLELDGQISDNVDEQRVALYGKPELEFNFSGLRELSLHNTWGDVKSWREQILRVMLRSPQLEHMSLSIARDTVDRLDMVSTDEDWEDWRFYLDLFQWLCHGYSVATGVPLKLKSLQLGYGIRSSDLADMENEFDPSILERIHIHNHYSDPPIYTLPWDMLQAINSPNLQYISLSDLNDECLSLAHENMAIKTPVGFRLGYHNLDDSDITMPSIFSWLAENEKLHSPMLILPSRPYDMKLELPPLRNNSWITAFSFELLVSRQSSDLQAAFRNSVGSTCEILATFSSLRYLWIRILNADAFETGSAAQQFAGACVSLCYVRVNDEAWGLSRDEDSSDVVLESLDEQEDEAEGLEFFKWGREVSLLD